ncbi:hypothetical protein [Anabaena azotica]
MANATLREQDVVAGLFVMVEILSCQHQDFVSSDRIGKTVESPSAKSG